MIIPLDRQRPKADQIYRYFREEILEGRLAPGARLPSSRRLALENNFARNTTVAAYNRLASEGYVQTEGPAGTRVSESIPRSVRDEPRARRGRPERPPRLSSFARRMLRAPDYFPPGVVGPRDDLRWDFLYNVNVSDRTSRRTWNRILRRCANRHETRAPDYDLSGRPGRLQRAIAAYLRRTRGVLCDPEQVVPLSSFQQAFQAAARLLVEPGETVAVEDPHRLGARNAFLANGVRVVPIRTDEDGLRVDELSETTPPRLVYLSPSHQWPSGAVVPLDRRLRLLEWARRHDVWLFENDHNTEFHSAPTPVMSLQGLDDSDRVLYVGTFSRLFSPDPFIAYIVVPPSLLDVFGAARNLESYDCSSLESEVLTQFLDEGHLESLARRTVGRIRPLRSTLSHALRSLPHDPFEVNDAGGGLHVQAELRHVASERSEDLVEACRRARVGVFSNRPYFLRPPRRAGLILGFARMSPEEIEEGVARLGDVVAQFA